MKSVISARHFHDEKAAYAFVEARVWPNGPVCPHCGGVDRISKMGGKSTRIGAYKCYQCRKPFTVKVGTVFEASHVPMRHWLQAMYLMSSSKKGVSSNQLHRTLGCTLKTAWFVSHRIREAMRVTGVEPMGGEGEIIEADETFIGRLEGQPKARAGFGHKNTVLTLVRRGGEARSFHVDSTSIASIVPILRAQIKAESKVMTDEANQYKALGKIFASHESVNHKQEEYSRGEVSTNTVEGFFSIFKRGMKGIYQHCSEKHLHRYLAEYDFRYTNRVGVGIDDTARTERALKGIVGKRLKYKTTHH
jgi:transposase-like protein